MVSRARLGLIQPEQRFKLVVTRKAQNVSIAPSLDYIETGAAERTVTTLHISFSLEDVVCL
jgi:hypothetical protein